MSERDELERLRGIVELYRIHMSVAGGPRPRCHDAALCGAMELCLEDLGEPVTRTDGIALSRMHASKGAEAILSRRTRTMLTVARERRRQELAAAAAERLGGVRAETTDGLSPCPQCGSPLIGWQNMASSSTPFRVLCPECGHGGPRCPTRENARAAWEREAERKRR